jgi:hypothetical protein
LLFNLVRKIGQILVHLHGYFKFGFLVKLFEIHSNSIGAGLSIAGFPAENKLARPVNSLVRPAVGNVLATSLDLIGEFASRPDFIMKVK